VDVEPPAADGSVVSTWLVRFRRGRLRWTERDVLDPARRHITFTQLQGDFAVMEGAWRIEAADRGAVVRFTARFDVGIPSLAEILEPVAETTLRENLLVILTGLLGPITAVDPSGLTA
jgi:ribosome-associated toxin RatA of RatAB toxin-antitoxin module